MAISSRKRLFGRIAVAISALFLLVAIFAPYGNAQSFYPFAFPIAPNGTPVSYVPITANTSGQVTWGPITATGLGPTPTPQLEADYNSLVQGNLYAPKYFAIETGFAPLMAPNAAVGPDGYLDAFNTNINSAAAGTGVSEVYFVNPPNVTQLTVSVPYALPSGATASAKVGVQITDTTGTTIYGSTYVLPSASWQTATFTVNVTGGTEYRFRLLTDQAVSAPTGQQNVLWGHPTVTPTASTDGFWTSGIIRYNLDAHLAFDQGIQPGVGVGPGICNYVYNFVTEDSRWKWVTNASQLAFEIYDWGTGGTDLIVEVNDRPFTNIQTSGSAQVRVVKITGLPGGINTVGIREGPQSVSNTALCSAQGQFPVAAYFPSTAYQVMLVPPPKTVDTVLILGTSKDSGTGYPTSTALGMMGDLLRATGKFERVLNFSQSGQSLYTWYAIGGNSMLPIAQSMASACDTRCTILLACYRNDWFGQGITSPWGGAAGADEVAWQTQMANLMDDFHMLRPEAQQVLVYTTHETNEGANTNGSTLANYASGFDTLFTNTQGWEIPPLKMDLRTAWSSGSASTYTVDGIHWNILGSSTVMTGNFRPFFSR